MEALERYTIARESTFTTLVIFGKMYAATATTFARLEEERLPGDPKARLETTEPETSEQYTDAMDGAE